MRILLTLLSLFLTLLPAQGAAATISGGIFYSTDTTGTNARASRITISPSSAGTNLLAGTLLATNQAWVASTLTNANLSVGTGDDLNYVPTAGLALPYRLEIRAGTTASPFTNTQPLVKIDRTEQTRAVDFFNGSGTTVEQSAILNLQAINTPSSQSQVTTIYAVAQSMATNVAGFQTNADACGIATTGRQVSNGVGYGIGLYAVGRTDSASGKTAGAEIRSWNESGADSLYNTAGASDMMGIWLNTASAAAKMSGAGLQIGSLSSSKFHVGIGATLVGGVSPVSGYNFLENNTATNGIVLGGIHSQAFSSGASAGPVQIGRTNIGTINTGALLEVYNNGTQSPLVAWQGANATDAITEKIGNAAGSGYEFVAGGSAQFTTDTTQGDLGFVVNTTNKTYRLGGNGNGSVIAVKNSGSAGQLGFYTATPVAKQDTDVQTALINYGLLVDSPLAGPQNNITLYDEFVNAVPGEFEWSTGVSGTAAAWSTGVGTGLRPGIVQFQSGTASNGLSGVKTTSGAFLFGGGRQIFKTAVRLPTLSDGTETYTVFIGFQDVTATVGESVDGAYFTYSSSPTYYITNTSVGSWVGKTANNSARSETAPTAAITGNQWYTLTIDANAAGTAVDFYVDGVLLGSITTNIPTGSSRVFALGYKLEKQAGLTSRNLDSDYCWWNFKPSTPR